VARPVRWPSTSITVGFYDERVSRLATRRLLPLICGLTLLAGCGSPPQPLPTAPPEPVGSGPLPSGSAGLPPAGLPTAGLPTAGLPGGIGGYPTPTLPPGVVVPTITTRPPTTKPTPTPAKRCTSGPTPAQVLAVIKGRPGMPDQELKVIEGPYCSGSWQFTIVGIAGASDEAEESLLVVTTGRPAALRVVEAGTDVCTERVEDDAPPGIRVRACGS
jgi:hypothetical protein